MKRTTNTAILRTTQSGASASGPGPCQPPTISASASGRSNGGRLVSAKPATMKITKPTNCGTTYHMPPCASTICVSDSDPAVRITPSSDSPSATSYEMSCAAERIAPRNEYFDPDAQPPSTRP